MSIFSELLSKIFEISDAYTKNFNEDLKVAFECLDKFEEEFRNAKGKAREKTIKDKINLTTLQSINEDDGEANKTPENKPNPSSSNNETANNVEKGVNSKDNEMERASKKRSKNEVDDMSSPEQDKRLKRNASVKAQSIISKQVNVNLTQKLRREDSTEKEQLKSRRRGKDDDKENTEPIPLVQVKQEKVSLPSEPMDLESLPINIEIKQEMNEDEIAMPPPTAPVPKPRKAIPKEKSEELSEEETGKRRATRTRKQTDTAPAPPVASARATRASSRASSRKQLEIEEEVPKETRPKRTRGKKIISEISIENDNHSQSTQDSAIGSPTENPRPKRTRRAQKAAEKEAEKDDAQPKEPETTSPKEERVSQPELKSPILQNKTKLNLTTKTTATKLPNEKTDKSKKANYKPDCNVEVTKAKLDRQSVEDTNVKDVLDATRVLPVSRLETPKLNATVTLNSDLDKTVVLPNGVCNHVSLTPKNMRNLNETVVIEPCNRETMVLDKPKNVAMDATVVLERLPQTAQLTDDNSLLTDDSDTPEVHTPPKGIAAAQPSSAVKEKVQQFEELASRITRTKTRAMAKKDEPVENHTPPDKISKTVLSAEQLNKMNNLIFNGKASQTSRSASKPISSIPTMKSHLSSSTSKLSGINKAKEAAEERQKKEKEDARRKKEAILEAKRELQRRKREEKMAAAAAAREAAEKERRAAMEAAVKERMEKQAHADQGKLERLKEAERKKLELARKVAETEERRRAEEQARLQRLAEEQKRAEAARRKQQEEAEIVKKEAATMAKEMEKRHKEYIEKQKMKLKMDGDRTTPLKSCLTGGVTVQEPVYMADGFQYLNSDSEEEAPEHPVPSWSTSKARRQRLYIQARISNAIVDRLFSVRAHTPDLRDIFPGIERARLKRTSSAVWRTPPSMDSRYKT
ncbi:unnamed protein product [Parnassius mnemosyne]|uniref:Inner centromere protein n=1 Tax=Parnassius mnemosyne TaxID=213953 RepID=A0AAV1M860_9NEOP